MEKELITRHGKFLLRPYQVTDEKAVIELWDLVFEQKMDYKWWKWKFADNPFGQQIVLAVNENDQPVTLYAGLPYRANWMGKEIRFSHPVDTLTHPDYRFNVSGRRGLYILAAEYFFDLFSGPEGSVFIYGFPGKRSYGIGKYFLKHSRLEQGSSYMALDPKKILKRNKPFLGTVAKLNPRKPIFNKLWNRVKKYYPFSVIRDNAFITWRFLENPKNTYDIYISRDWLGRPNAYAIISRNPIKGVVSILDILAIPDRKVIGNLISKIVQDPLQKKIKYVEIWIPIHHFISKILLEYGFVEVSEPLGINPAGRSFYDKLDFDFAAKNMFFTMADGDLF